MTTAHVRGQLEFEFEGDTLIGTLDEAMELWESQFDRVCGNSNGAPPGWKYVGSGGTRVVYKSPSGVCYKVCYEYDDEEDETHNEVEHKNMRRIDREGKLPKGWRVPKTHLHIFQGHVKRWDYHMRKPKQQPARVVILATDYIDGELVGWSATEDDQNEMSNAFSAVGLCDTGGDNAVKAKDGTRYIIDAAEWMPPEEN